MDLFTPALLPKLLEAGAGLLALVFLLWFVQKLVFGDLAAIRGALVELVEVQRDLVNELRELRGAPPLRPRLVRETRRTRRGVGVANATD
ncbi:hypothetical protein Mterra_01894 [Calidithermus terrae]|uniref:Uncharacterized protein n=1 Tax=Calidithermus terrae TaxID=1408545 RepID=A0A399EJ15_9DEIN|nr:hypothetical protein [Calidithermus terrae]RIH84714.1 hypothetical protein Mterra_01894 [Calidithermus terrae]